MGDNFENMINAMQTFHLLDKLENYKNENDYKYFCELLSNLYFEMIAIDTIDSDTNE